MTSGQLWTAWLFADLSGPIAERLSHGDVTHSRRTGWLSVVQCLSSLGRPGNGKNGHKKSIICMLISRVSTCEWCWPNAAQVKARSLIHRYSRVHSPQCSHEEKKPCNCWLCCHRLVSQNTTTGPVLLWEAEQTQCKMQDLLLCQVGFVILFGWPQRLRQDLFQIIVWN